MAPTSSFLTFILETTPLQVEVDSPATLTLIGNNQHPDPGTDLVFLTEVVVTIPIGKDASELTEGLPTLTPPPNWTLSSKSSKGNLESYTFTPDSSPYVVGIQPLAFTVNQFTVNSEIGSAPITVEQTAMVGNSPQTESRTLPLVKAPEGWSAVSFSASPPIVQSGANSNLQLNWNGPVGATYQISYVNGEQQEVVIPSDGQAPLAYTGFYPGQFNPPLVLYQTTTFYLNVSMTIGQQLIAEEFQTTVTVVPSSREGVASISFFSSTFPSR